LDIYPYKLADYCDLPKKPDKFYPLFDESLLFVY